MPLNKETKPNQTWMNESKSTLSTNKICVFGYEISNEVV